MHLGRNLPKYIFFSKVKIISVKNNYFQLRHQRSDFFKKSQIVENDKKIYLPTQIFFLALNFLSSVKK